MGHISHRFNPLDVASIRVTGALEPSRGDRYIYINEFVVR